MYMCIYIHIYIYIYIRKNSRVNRKGFYRSIIAFDEFADERHICIFDNIFF